VIIIPSTQEYMKGLLSPEEVIIIPSTQEYVKGLSSPEEVIIIIPSNQEYMKGLSRHRTTNQETKSAPSLPTRITFML